MKHPYSWLSSFSLAMMVGCFVMTHGESELYSETSRVTSVRSLSKKSQEDISFGVLSQI